MTTAATGMAPGSSAQDEPRWHYRRSLASRVILMTTMAVSFAVALVSLGAYVPVKMSLQNSLDTSLTERAHEAARSNAVDILLSGDLPAAVLGAGDVRMFIVRSDGTHTNDTGPVLRV